ncbi:MAG: ComEC family competence protein [Flavobacteriaceae bacterium]|nr:ComEC family competence protein [Flavobacteriaceae bacterium]
MQLLNFTIIKLTIALVTGVLIGSYSNLPVNYSLLICLILLFLLGISYVINRTRRKKTILFGLISFLLFSSIGNLTSSFNNQQNHLNHYTNHFNHELDTIQTFVFKIREVLKPGNYYDKYIIDIKKINDQNVTGKSLLNVQKDSSNSALKVDDLVITKTVFKDLNSPLNPHQFNYRSYLKNKYIYHQLLTKKKELLILDREKTSFFGFAAQLRENINDKLKTFDFKKDELAIINALILGQRQDISEEIYSSYTKAGAIHILAVSGLHVGIILLLLNFLFKPLERIKHGYFIKKTLLLLVLWSFAVIAGLSPSVTRAVTMFSIVAIGMNLKRPANIYNTLAISMFVLLLIKPTFLFDVGFQLSYLAVFSIVWIQPKLYEIWNPKFWLSDKFWQIFTVTIAAQIGVVPLSLYYFHQFPGLFFISNLVIIPVLGFILGFGIFTIILALIGILPQIMASAFGYIISIMNDFVMFISKQEDFLFKDISFGLLSVVASYLLIISLVNLYKNRSYRFIAFALISTALFISVQIYYKYENSSNEFLIFHKSRYSLIGFKKSTNLELHHNLDSLTLAKQKLLTNYKIGNSIEEIKADSIRSVYRIKDKLMLIVDSLGAYKTTFKTDYVLLRNSPKINLTRLIDHLKPELIIADGSNYKSYQERWLKTCLKKEIPFHQTNKKGAFIIEF